ncbi:glycosyltransferase family 4 protein [Sphingomonas sp. BN140010]|uniref:Glycosyltransferase family 4 protein n=1 Tax=Sphingomonas arvum TaxID=2992113 RepID=A0ABT3JEM5_9SPHN|nr:glycosyltransferase family 4 protein [Sphingomonas sp. BN140010]MCW3797517.1 glycosyltransferase family 4 protein [Sphingomonas sp. BN140010]
MPAKPLIVIYTGAVEVTGAMIAAYRQAIALKDDARFAIVVSDRASIRAEDFPEVSLLRLPLARVARTARSLLGYPLGTLRSARRLARLLSELGCTRLQVNDFYLLEGALTRLFGFRGTIVTWVRIDPSRYGGLLASVWLRTAAAASSSVVTVSRFMQQRLHEWSTKAELVYDPCPDLPLATPPAGKRLVFIGNYSAGKGQDVAIRAFAAVASRAADARLELYGSDLALERNRQYRRSLVELVNELGLVGQVVVGDFMPEPGDVLDGTLVALNLSESESFSLTCQEASARGVAVIATRCGGPEEIVHHGESGWLVPVGDSTAITEAMRAALADPHRTHRMGQAGAKLVRKRFSPTIFRKQITRLFNLAPVAVGNDGAST